MVNIPQDENAENAAIGIAMNDNYKFVDLLANGLCEDHFFHKDNKIIFNSMFKLNEENKPVSLMSIGSLHPDLISRIIDQCEKAPMAENHEYYLDRLIKKLNDRKVLEYSQDIFNKCFDDDRKNIIEYSSNELEKLIDDRSIKMPTPIKLEAEPLLNEIEEKLVAKKSGEKVDFVLPFKAMNNVIKFEKGEIITVAARPGMGKTSFAITLCDAIAKQEKNVVFISLEMTRRELSKRLLSMESNIPIMALRNMTFGEHLEDNVFDGIKKLYQNNLIVDDERGQTIQKIRSKLRILKRKQKLDFVCIDYLTLIKTVERYRDLRLQIGGIMKTLKEMAGEFECPIMVLCQLSRKADENVNQLPKRSHLKESGNIEEDSDYVFAIYRQSTSEFKNDKNKKRTLRDDQAMITTLKNRHGPEYDFTVGFQLDTNKFFDEE